eukprot:1425924-Heterocapsa_arctica.AAC.1
MTSSFGADLDPQVELLLRRTTTMRRMICKHPHEMDRVRRIHSKYKALGYQGTQAQAAGLEALAVAPPPGSGKRTTWKGTIAAMGP